MIQERIRYKIKYRYISTNDDASVIVHAFTLKGALNIFDAVIDRMTKIVDIIELKEKD